MTTKPTYTEPIFGCMEQWNLHLKGELDGGLDSILHPDVVFLSPIVFSPQKGIDITKLYLGAAGGTLGGDDGSSFSGSGAEQSVGVKFSTTSGSSKAITQCWSSRRLLRVSM